VPPALRGNRFLIIRVAGRVEDQRVVNGRVFIDFRGLRAGTYAIAFWGRPRTAAARRQARRTGRNLARILRIYTVCNAGDVSQINVPPPRR
jgi:hypothetical protein